MLFNSYVFIFGFLPLTLIIFFTLSRFRLTRLAIAWLAVASLIFYSYWSVAYLPLMLLSIGVNYSIGRAIGQAAGQSRPARIWLTSGIIFNLSLLGYYKYAGFFVTSLNSWLDAGWSVPSIILPLGISFYTFTQTAYLVDAYRGETKSYDFLTYLLFVTFFPHLIAGPILHHSDVIPQFYHLRNFIFSQKNMALGAVMFSLGLAKKVLIADTLSPWVSSVFEHTHQVSFLEAWVGALSYTFQLYFDFSGYSDMAVGLGLMLNIALPINFDSPYKATSIIDFWRRWHITLSNFLRDYLYIPLGGSRKGDVRRYLNLFTTMLLGGLWHGAGWTFVIWGGLHGAYLCINHAWRKLNLMLPDGFMWVVTFLAVLGGWVVFRAQTVPDAIALLHSMSGWNGIILPGSEGGKLSMLSGLGIQIRDWGEFSFLPELRGSKRLPLIVLAGLLLWVRFLPNTQQILARFQPTWWWAVGTGILAGFCLLSLNRVSEFLYFQF